MNNAIPRRTGQSVELAVGAFLLLALATLLVLAFASTNGDVGFGGRQYQLIAKFGNIGELRTHAPVKIGGVVVGEVAKIALDPKNYGAVVTLALDPAYKNLPADTNARILTAGLLGERYVGLDPGGDPETLPSGGEIIYTQNAIVLEDLIAKFIFGTGGKPSNVPATDAGAADTGTSATGSGNVSPVDATPAATASATAKPAGKSAAPQEKRP
jgi:phospholipid/cholesterol/gamma-HCH transport system substrate-binding protein